MSRNKFCCDLRFFQTTNVPFLLLLFTAGLPLQKIFRLNAWTPQRSARSAVYISRDVWVMLPFSAGLVINDNKTKAKYWVLHNFSQVTGKHYVFFFTLNGIGNCDPHHNLQRRFDCNFAKWQISDLLKMLTSKETSQLLLGIALQRSWFLKCFHFWAA